MKRKLTLDLKWGNTFERGDNFPTTITLEEFYKIEPGDKITLARWGDQIFEVDTVGKFFSLLDLTWVEGVTVKDCGYFPYVLYPHITSHTKKE